MPSAWLPVWVAGHSSVAAWCVWQLLAGQSARDRGASRPIQRATSVSHAVPCASHRPTCCVRMCTRATPRRACNDCGSVAKATPATPSPRVATGRCPVDRPFISQQQSTPPLCARGCGQSGRDHAHVMIMMLQHCIWCSARGLHTRSSASLATRCSTQYATITRA